MSRPENDRFLRALRREAVDRPPVWIMRQAGRYLPEYRATRAKAGSFLNLCKNPELCSEVVMQPLLRFPQLDAAILFSDILTVPDAMGLELRFETGEGPVFDNPIRSRAQIDNLPVPDPEVELRYVMDAVRTIKDDLAGRVPLIGFAGSPWTIACYAVEGRGSKDFHRIKALRYTDPDGMHHLLDKITTTTVAYLQGQVAAGAQALMVFDTWGGQLSTADYREFSLNYGHAIRSAIDPRIPMLWFTKGGGQWLEVQVDAGFDGLGLDWTVDLARARAQVGARVALQGNLDPATLLGSPEMIAAQTRKVLDAAGPAPGYIFNLGHGITPDVTPDALGAVLETIDSYPRR
ncbi:MAG: uroporphyrinogen decarboxylase [Oceanococcaceae bacterium]